MPKYGAVIDADGRILHSSVEEALYITPTLGRLPFVKREENRVIFDPPVSCEEYERGTVFLPWGALNNYGHFVIDGLAALAAVSEQVLLPSFPPLVPSLAPWQRELLDLFLGDQPRIEVRSDVVRIKDVLFANPMAHFLHKPNGLIRTVRRRILARAPNRPSSTGARLYFSRAGLKKRVMTNEPELEALLKAEGFVILHPERFSVAEQIRMVQEASVIVGATGAALANGIFLPERSAVVEILPDRVMSRWVRSLCDENALRWHGFFCRVVEPVQPTKIEGIDRIVNFDYELPLGPFKGFLESLL
jgi:capsular polysaccharide biosynthesis protein